MFLSLYSCRQFPYLRLLHCFFTFVSCIWIYHREYRVDERLVNVDNIAANLDDVDKNSSKNSRKIYGKIYRIGKNEVVPCNDDFTQCFGDCNSMTPKKVRDHVHQKDGTMLTKLAEETKEKLSKQGVSRHTTDKIYHQVMIYFAFGV